MSVQSLLNQVEAQQAIEEAASTTEEERTLARIEQMGGSSLMCYAKKAAFILAVMAVGKVLFF